jgi:hypothetical protein
MPAINLARLRQQCALLVEQFDQPQAFLRTLHDLLEVNAERTLRPGQAGKHPPLIQTYNVPLPMLRQVTKELSSLAPDHAAQTLALSDALWAEPFLETRLLAASLLGQAPLESFEAVIIRVERWMKDTTEEQLISALIEQGLWRALREQPARLLEQVDLWLGKQDILQQRLGLRVLLRLAIDPDYENLPAILHSLMPFARTVPMALRSEVLDLLAGLAHRSPGETAYFLRQNLEVTENPDTAWLIRQTLPHFPPATKESLRSVLRQIK